MVQAIFRFAVLLAILLVVGLVVFVALTYSRFREDVQTNRERLLSGSDIMITEDFGDIEYAVQGKGPPVLLVHGAGGGYDQGLLIGENYVGDGHHFIAPSRFGYIRSSIPQNGSLPHRLMPTRRYSTLLASSGWRWLGSRMGDRRRCSLRFGTPSAARL